jgi:hypothetical protein
MNSRIFSPRSVTIVACLVLVATVVIIAGWFLFWNGPGSAVAGGGATSIGDTSVQYVLSTRGVALIIWSDANGECGSSSDSNLFSSSARGFFSSANGRRIHWEWKRPREKGGDFLIDGTPHDLAKGAVFLVSTKANKVQVKQLDVDVSSLQPNQRGLEALAKEEPRIAKFIGDASRQK